MIEPKTLYKTRVPLIEDHPVPPKTMDILKAEISAIKANKWLDPEEKKLKLKKLKDQIAPRMPQHVFEALLN